MKLISSSDIFVSGAPIAAGVPFDATDRQAVDLAWCTRPATAEEIAAAENNDATTAANEAADRRNSGTAALSTEDREAASISRATKSKAKASK
jgi:hypothetical protein